MALSVSCPSCGKRFDNINPKHAGKKAKCACGNVVRLGARKGKESDSDSPFPDDLMEVDLLGDELLGDDLLGDDLLGPTRAPVVQSDPSGKPGVPAKDRQPPEVNRPAKRQAQPKQKQTSAKDRNQGIKNDPEPKPSSPRAVDANEPVFDQSYSDLESILEGTGDAAPIVARPAEDGRNGDGENGDGANGESVVSKRAGSPVGFLSAILSGTLAFWFGVFALISKFKVIDQLLTSGFSQALHRMYTGDFSSLQAVGSVEQGTAFKALFSILGWSFWVVAVCLMLVGAAQFSNSFYRLLTKRHFFRRIDGVTATCGVVAMFLMVGWIFVQSSLQRDQHKFLNDYEKPATVNGEHLEVVTLLRKEVDQQHLATRNWLLVGALIPMSIFVLSMTRLLTLDPDRRSRSLD